MKAAIYRKHEKEKIVVGEAPKPVPKENEVLVKIYAASVNALDYRSMRMGILRDGRVIGADIAGRVEAAGSGVKRLKTGDAVFGDIFHYTGGFAEYAAVPEDVLGVMPPGVSFGQAAAIPVAGITALQALGGENGVSAGQSVMVLGAGGGVGTFAVQLAVYFGAEVIAVCGESNIQLMKSFGVQRVIDYRKEDFLSGGEPYDLILAVNGNYPLTRLRRALRPEGKLVVVGGALRQIFRAALLRRKSGGRRVSILAAKPNAKELEYLAGLVRGGVLKPVIDRAYPLDKAAEAVNYLANGHARGKVVISIIPE